MWLKPRTDVIVSERGNSSSVRLVRNNFWLSSLLGTRTIIPRSICTFESYRLSSNLTGARLRKSLVLKAKANSPFRNPQVRLHLGTTNASAWTWDGDLVATQLGLSNRHVIPESAFHPKTDGYRIIETIDGHEGELWVGGELVESRWWPDPVSVENWRQFILATEHLSPPPAGLPATVPFDGRFRSAQADHTPLEELAQRFRSRELIVAAIVALAAPLIIIGARSWYLTQIETRLQAQFDRERVAKAQLRRDASETQAMVDQAASISQALSSAQPLMAVADAVEQITKMGGSVQRIHFDANGLEIGFSASSAFSQPEFVRNLEDLDSIEKAGIRAETSTGQWAVTFSAQTGPSEQN